MFCLPSSLCGPLPVPGPYVRMCWQLVVYPYMSRSFCMMQVIPDLDLDTANVLVNDLGRCSLTCLPRCNSHLLDAVDGPLLWFR